MNPLPNPVEAIGAIERTSTVGQVVDQVRAAILDGALDPGTPLREQALADRLGVSRGTVREALRVLTADGLVQHRAHRGVVVASLDARDAADVFRARIVLESAGARVVAADPARFGTGLHDAIEAMRRAARRRHVVSFVDAHAEFHAALVEPLGSARLDRFFLGLEGELRLHLARLERMSGSLRASVDEHAVLAEQICGGDPELAAKVVAEHLAIGGADVEHDVSAGSTLPSGD